MSDPVCPCQRSEQPWTPSNIPGLTTLRYRVGDYASVRRALLRGRDGESALRGWSPGAEGDLAVQVAEWWAYLAEVLGFYNERAAHEMFLRTATDRGATTRLVGLLGYRPRPAIGAHGTLGVIVRAKLPVVLPVGLAIQSKPGPGESPQVFEVDEKTEVHPGGVQALTAPVLDTFSVSGDTIVAHLRGVIESVATGERLLLVKKALSGDFALSDYALVRVATVVVKSLSDGSKLTELELERFAGAVPVSSPRDYKLMRARASAPSYSHKATSVFRKSSRLHLDLVVREIAAGDLLWFDGGSSQVVRCTAARSSIWYANAAVSSPKTAPTGEGVVPFPIVHTRVSYARAVGSAAIDASSRPKVFYDFRPVGELIGEPASETSNTGSGALTLASSADLVVGQQVLIEDATDRGVEGTVTAPTEVSFTPSGVPETLRAPLRALTNHVHVSRGKTVPREVLGSGDPTIAGQSFALKQSPLTWLSSKDPKSFAPYASTLRVWVDGVEWTEVASFYGQSPNARVFVTREDDDQKTHVMFGDGEHGVRLPPGVGNVVASYRYGAGRQSPSAGALTSVLTPIPGLVGVRNPVPVGGGDDRDPPEKIQRYAPRSVLTFDRAVSADDFETIALDAPGVTRARAYYAWSAAEQRVLVKVYVDGDASAVSEAKEAIARASDPTRPVEVLPVRRALVRLSATVVVAPRFIVANVEAAVAKALTDEELGLFGTRRAVIGKAVYDSEIYAVCHKVPGVAAIKDLALVVLNPSDAGPQTSERHEPAEGKVFRLDPATPLLTMQEVTS